MCWWEDCAMMRWLAVLCLVSAVTAGPGWPAVIEVREGPSYPRHHQLPLQDTQDPTQVIPDEKDLGVVEEEGGERDVIDTSRPSVIIRGLQEQLMEDLLRMEQDLLLIRRLMGQGQLSFPSERRPPLQPPSSPWTFPLLPPFRRTHPSWTDEGEGEGDEGDSTSPAGHHDSPWFHFPGLGFDRPVLLPDFPALPSGGETPNFDELPDNYDNSTHEVHVVNGSRVEVNTTTNKKTGDGFNSFFHHQVIHVHPDPETLGEVPVGEGEVVVTVEEGEGEPPVATDTPEVEDEVVTGTVDRVLPFLPEVENEVSGGSLGTVTEVPTKPEEVTEGREKAQRVSRGASAHDFPKPKTVAYVIHNNSIQRDDGDADEAEPDLSKDTRVNHVGSDGQGLSKVEPEAEVFDLGLVLKEAETSTKDD